MQQQSEYNPGQPMNTIEESEVSNTPPHMSNQIIGPHSTLEKTKKPFGLIFDENDEDLQCGDSVKSRNIAQPPNIQTCLMPQSAPQNKILTSSPQQVLKKGQSYSNHVTFKNMQNNSNSKQGNGQISNQNYMSNSSHVNIAMYNPSAFNSNPGTYRQKMDNSQQLFSGTAFSTQKLSNTQLQQIIQKNTQNVYISQVHGPNDGKRKRHQAIFAQQITGRKQKTKQKFAKLERENQLDTDYGNTYPHFQRATQKSIQELISHETYTLTSLTIVLFTFIFDMIIKSNVGYYDKGSIIMSRKKVTIKYLKHELYKDIFSLIPLLDGFFSFPNPLSILNLLIVFKLSDIYQIMNKFNHIWTVKRHKTIPTLIKITRLFLILWLAAHIIGCLFLWIGKSEYIEQNYGNTWILGLEIQNKSWEYQYIQCLYWAVTTITTVGYGDITPKNQLETLFVTLVMFVACFSFGYIFSQIGNIVDDLRKEEQNFIDQMQKISRYFDEKNISKHLRNEIRKYWEYKHLAESKLTVNESKHILEQLPDNLQQKLIQNANMPYLENFPLFKKYFSKQFLQALSLQMEELQAVNNEIIFKYGEKNQEGDLSMYFVQQGKVALYRSRSTIINRGYLNQAHIIKSVTQGQFFGEVTCLYGHPREYSAKSLGSSLLLMLKYSTFREVIKHFPDDYENYKFLVDQVNCNNQVDCLQIQCICCHRTGHEVLSCPRLHFSPDKEKIILTNNFPLIQYESQTFKRQHKEKNFNVWHNLSDLQDDQEFLVSDLSTKKLEKYYRRQFQDSYLGTILYQKFLNQPFNTSTEEFYHVDLYQTNNSNINDSHVNVNFLTQIKEIALNQMQESQSSPNNIQILKFLDSQLKIEEQKQQHQQIKQDQYLKQQSQVQLVKFLDFDDIEDEDSQISGDQFRNLLKQRSKYSQQSSQFSMKKKLIKLQQQDADEVVTEYTQTPSQKKNQKLRQFLNQKKKPQRSFFGSALQKMKKQQDEQTFLEYQLKKNETDIPFLDLEDFDYIKLEGFKRYYPNNNVKRVLKMLKIVQQDNLNYSVRPKDYHLINRMKQKLGMQLMEDENLESQLIIMHNNPQAYKNSKLNTMQINRTESDQLNTQNVLIINQNSELENALQVDDYSDLSLSTEEIKYIPKIRKQHMQPANPRRLTKRQGIITTTTKRPLFAINNQSSE